MELRICHLYPDLLNLYGDRGNITTLVRRAQWRGIDTRIVEARLGDAIDPDGSDLYFIGGGEDRQQRLAAPDLCGVKGDALRRRGGLGRGRARRLRRLPAARRLLPAVRRRRPDGPGTARSAHTASGPRRRLIGNIIIRESSAGVRLVGFENHGGRTHLGPRAQPLGMVEAGFGNNGTDGTEGAVSGSVYGTYLHGPLLPKNPWLADLLIGLALRRRHGDVRLDPLADAEEHRAADAAAQRR